MSPLFSIFYKRSTFLGATWLMNAYGTLYSTGYCCCCCQTNIPFLFFSSLITLLHFLTLTSQKQLQASKFLQRWWLILGCVLPAYIVYRNSLCSPIFCGTRMVYIYNFGIVGSKLGKNSLILFPFSVLLAPIVTLCYSF